MYSLLSFINRQIQKLPFIVQSLYLTWFVNHLNECKLLNTLTLLYYNFVLIYLNFISFHKVLTAQIQNFFKLKLLTFEKWNFLEQFLMQSSLNDINLKVWLNLFFKI